MQAQGRFDALELPQTGPLVGLEQGHGTSDLALFCDKPLAAVRQQQKQATLVPRAGDTGLSHIIGGHLVGS